MNTRRCSRCVSAAPAGLSLTRVPPVSVIVAVPCLRAAFLQPLTLMIALLIEERLVVKARTPKWFKVWSQTVRTLAITGGVSSTFICLGIASDQWHVNTAITQAKPFRTGLDVLAASCAADCACCYLWGEIDWLGTRTRHETIFKHTVLETWPGGVSPKQSLPLAIPLA